MSADKIDHKAEVQRLIEGLHDYQSEEGMSDASMLTVAIEAQAHATLYAAEQAHLANLIAFLAIAEARGAADADYRTLDQSVREGLTLS